jgi:transcriptional regulator with XRE-family HTH domain
MPPQRKSEPRSPEHAALGKAVETIIAKDPNMTQDSVAFEGGLDVKQVNELVRGQSNPTYTTILKVCKGLKVRPGKLMTLSDKLLDKRSGR